jgi:hypothetical protein
MPRPPVGTDTQPRSDTALFAHIAWRLEDVGIKDLESWTHELGIRVGEKAIREAPKTAQRLLHLPGGSPVRRTALIDYAALDFFTALVTLRTKGDRDEVIRKVGQVRGVVELLSVEDSEDVLALVVFERLSDKRTLEGMLSEHADIRGWQTIEERRHQPAAMTFRSLALDAAARERLLVEQ